MVLFSFMCNMSYKPSKPDKRHCNYYQASEHQKGFLGQCKYCERYFCNAHINPRPAGLRQFQDYNKISKELQEEAENPNSHPCIQYIEHFDKKAKEQDEKYRLALGRFLGSNRKQDLPEENNPIVFVKKPPIESLDNLKKDNTQKLFPIKPFDNKKPIKETKKKDSGLGIWIALALFLFSLILVPFIHTDETIKQKDYSSISNTAFNYINEFRQSKNLEKFDKNPNALKLALFLAKDTSSSSNLNENSKKELQNKFNIAGSVSFFNSQINEATGDTIEQIVLKWENNELWNAPLLNSSYKSGAISCYDDRCWMIVSTEKSSSSMGLKQRFLNWFNSSSSQNYASNNKVNDNYTPKTDINKVSSEIKNFVNSVVDPKSQIDISELEQEVNRLINLERTNQGLRPLIWDDKIGLIAREHSQDMANRNFFAHENPEGEDPTARSNRHGYSCMKDYGSYYTYGLAENIAETPVYSNVEGCGSTTSLDSLAECIVDGWMQSPGHRENILTKTYTKTGIGISYSSDDKAYSTQDFC